MQFRKPYDREAEAAARAAARTVPEGESKTQRQFAKDADLNEIVRRMGATSAPIPQAGFDPGHYGDFTNLPSLTEAILRIRNGEAHFQALPAKVRRYFNNDPMEFLDFATNPANKAEMVALGLIAPEMPDTGSQGPEGAQIPPRPANGAEAPPVPPAAPTNAAGG